MAFGKFMGPILIGSPIKKLHWTISKTIEISIWMNTEQTVRDNNSGVVGINLGACARGPRAAESNEFQVLSQGQQHLLLEILHVMQHATSDNFVMVVKLNSKDNHSNCKEREDKCLELIQELYYTGLLDFIELSEADCYEDMLTFKNEKKEETIAGDILNDTRKEIDIPPTN
eukprot:scaffold6674_cov74-Attheya_sp.AAC.2